MAPAGEFNSTRAARDTDDGASVIIPAVDLNGSPQDRLRTIDAALRHLQHVRSALIGEAPAPSSYEPPRRYITGVAVVYGPGGCWEHCLSSSCCSHGALAETPAL
jgi:hypothetical protein